MVVYISSNFPGVDCGKMQTYSFQILNVYELNSLQVIISVIYKALAVLGEVQHSQPDGDDVVHPGVA